MHVMGNASHLFVCLYCGIDWFVPFRQTAHCIKDNQSHDLLELEVLLCPSNDFHACIQSRT